MVELSPAGNRDFPAFQWRAVTGGVTGAHEPTPGPTAIPMWVRVVRAGNTFTGYWAKDNGDGTHGAWTFLGAEPFSVAPVAYVGLLVTAHNNSTIMTSTFDNVQILPAVQQTSHFDVSASARAVNPGNPATVTVVALDQYNNPVPGYLGTVHFTSSDKAAGLPIDYTFNAGDNGRHVFSVTLPTLGRPTIFVADAASSTLGGGTALNVTNDVIASSLIVSGFPSPSRVGVQGSFTVTARDAQGNTLTGYRGTVHFVSSDPRAQLPADYTFTAADAGMHTFTAPLNTPGTQTIAAMDFVAGVTGTDRTSWSARRR